MIKTVHSINQKVWLIVGTKMVSDRVETIQISDGETKYRLTQGGWHHEYDLSKSKKKLYKKLNDDYEADKELHRGKGTI